MNYVNILRFKEPIFPNEYGVEAGVLIDVLGLCPKVMVLVVVNS